MLEKKIKFCCHICGYKKYSTVKQNNGMMGSGYKEWVLYYFCKGCSVVFLNPEKFTGKEIIKSGKDTEEQKFHFFGNNIKEAIKIIKEFLKV